MMSVYITNVYSTNVYILTFNLNRSCVCSVVMVEAQLAQTRAELSGCQGRTQELELAYDVLHANFTNSQEQLATKTSLAADLDQVRTPRFHLACSQKGEREKTSF